MTPQDGLAIASGLLVGFILAMVGGGGSILATPLLLYVVGVGPPHVAIGTSALAVSVNAFANLIAHSRQGNVKWPCAAVFAASGVLGAIAGARLGKATDPSVLLPLFAVAMAGVGVSMLLPKADGPVEEVHLSARNAPKLIGAGFLVGGLSGFFGIGGGFLIVPGLMAASGMAMINAIGSSLLSVGAFGAATAASYAQAGLIDFRIAGLFVLGGVAGGLMGMAVGKRLAQNRALLQRLFAVVVFLAAAYVLYRSLTAA